MNRGPNNYFDIDTLTAVADSIDFLVAQNCRAIVLCSAGKNFCAGADFSGREGSSSSPGVHVYDIAARIFRAQVPLVAAVQGSAIGGGLGLAMAADFRVGSPSTRLAANFAQLGFHQGFALSLTLPRAVGEQTAAELLLTGRRIGGDDGHRLGLLDHLVSDDQIRERASELAHEIATSAPLAVDAIRRTMRGNLAERAVAAMAHERSEQERLQKTNDFREGVRAVAERRTPDFQGN
jgi:enoyl-CoA hydratase/carnithine racemase